MNTLILNSFLTDSPMTQEKPEQLLKASDVAERLGVSERTVQRLTQRGLLVGYKIGRILKFRLSDVENYLERVRTDNLNKNN
ncbi:MAG: helix-turn-helix domain-containing protein [Blastocatellia bacterium]|nr:helix-turn-helix domain-containing protein [Blastocatellia bacterium]